MPDELSWRNVSAYISENSSIPLWIDRTSPGAVFAYQKFQACRALRVARFAFLATLKVKPSGVSDYEFLIAHGLTLEALGTERARRIGL